MKSRIKSAAAVAVLAGALLVGDAARPAPAGADGDYCGHGIYRSVYDDRPIFFYEGVTYNVGAGGWHEHIVTHRVYSWWAWWRYSDHTYTVWCPPH